MDDRAMQVGTAVGTPFPAPRPGWPVPEPLVLDDGYRTQVYRHRAVGGTPSRLPVLYLHGIQSHPGWFFASAAALAGDGHEVFQVTRRGSGTSCRDRGHARSAGQLLADIAAAEKFVLARMQAERLHLVGVSWGGKLAAVRAAQGAEAGPIASLTLIAPGIAARVDVSARVKLGVAACLFACPRKGFAIPLNDPELFTDNEAMRGFLRGDPLRLRRATARLMYASRRLDRMLAGADEGMLKMPVTLILSARDRIIDNDAVRWMVGRLTAGQADVRELPGAHTLEFEPDPNDFHAALLAACAKGEA